MFLVWENQFYLDQIINFKSFLIWKFIHLDFFLNNEKDIILQIMSFLSLDLFAQIDL